MLKTLVQFIVRVMELDDVSDAYYVFEEECSPALCDQIYSLADKTSPEPFRSAMINMGFDDF
jgi:hypothetical protein